MRTPSSSAVASDLSAVPVSGRVRTSISLSQAAQERGRALMLAEGFPNFSEMIEYLIRRQTERQAA